MIVAKIADIEAAADDEGFDLDLEAILIEEFLGSELAGLDQEFEFDIAA